MRSLKRVHGAEFQCDTELGSLGWLGVIRGMTLQWPEGDGSFKFMRVTNEGAWRASKTRKKTAWMAMLEIMEMAP